MNCVYIIIGYQSDPALEEEHIFFLTNSYFPSEETALNYLQDDILELDAEEIGSTFVVKREGGRCRVQWYDVQYLIEPFTQRPQIVVKRPKPRPVLSSKPPTPERQRLINSLRCLRYSETGNPNYSRALGLLQVVPHASDVCAALREAIQLGYDEVVSPSFHRGYLDEVVIPLIQEMEEQLS